MKQQREIWAGLVVLTRFAAPVPLAGQVVLTAPKESDVRFRRHSLARWRIAAGQVTT